MLKEFKADLHIHTCLSPCAELDMTPSFIVKTASEKGIDIIAITDHNSSENITAARRCAEQHSITVLGGMEITSAEEAHILALFDDNDSIHKLQEIIYGSLLPGDNDEKRFGEQVVVNEKDEVLAFNTRILIAATELPAQSITAAIHELGGIAVASHIDKAVFSVVSQLGFIADDMGFDALEMSPNISRELADEQFKLYNTFAWISSSDAHYPSDIGKRTSSFHMNSPTISEMKLAMQRIDGRKVEWE
jgi:PHP family Zn ribbon phosphoesterase